MPPDWPAAVLWDMDGTVIDTEPYWIAAEHDLVASYGGTWTDELGLHLVGNPLIVSAEFIKAHSPVALEPLQIVERLVADVAAMVRREARWRPGATELLAELGRLGVPCALVTMSWESLAAAVVSELPEGTFSVVVTGDQVAHGKPHPEAYLRAAERLNLPPSRCLAIEDSPTGVRSAVAAGVPTVAVPHVVPVPPVEGAIQLDSLAGVRAAELFSLTH
jgi:HAD superfamily hydrolase (TIGR01509 family)